MRLHRARLAVALFFTLCPPAAFAQTWPAALAVSAVEGGRVGSTAYRSSSRLAVTWTAPPAAVHHYVLTLTDGVTGAAVSVQATETRVTVSGLKSATPHTVSVKACLDDPCASNLDGDATARGQTEAEYWQVQGSGSSYSGATRIVSDGNTYPFALPYGSWAGGLSGKVQLYYNPTSGTEKGIKIVDPETGRVAPYGTPGELCTRGYSVMLEYWADEEATAAAIDGARWMRTGDLAVMRPDGAVNIVGRLKDMIICGGENIYPREIEEFLYTHPKVAEVAVIGVPDVRYGEQVCAWIRLREGCDAAEEELRAFCHGQIATYKIPRYLRFTTEFPTTVTGKIQKFRMREISIQELALGAAAESQTA